MNNLNLNSDPKTLFLDSNINQDIKKLSRSKSENSPKYQNKKGGLMRRNSSNDSILGINSYFDKEIPPPPPYDVHSNSSNPNSTTITTTTTTTTVTTVTTTMISNSGDSTSKQQQSDTNSSSNVELPNITVVSYESSCDTNNNEPKVPENSNFALNGDNKRKRSGSAPSVPIISFKGQDENKYKSNTVPSAKSMVNLLESGRNTVLLNKSYKESPQQYLEKLRDTLSKSELATLLTKSKDVFHETVLRTYMETFDFTSDPIDIALRKFLMDCHLPKETQQIDRVMESFAKRYHDCNPGLFTSPDTTYILSFSLLMLHTDAFNKSVKRKMTKEEFVKNSRIDGVPPEILEILYDNITFMRFIYADDDTDVNGQTMLSSSSSKNRNSMIFGLLDRSSCVKNDPYFVIKHKVPTEYTPSIEHLVPIENPFSHKGTLSEFDTVGIHRAFTTSHTIRITGVRTQRNNETFNQTSSSIHPLDDEEGTFLLKITKVGKLSRKVDLLEGKKAGVMMRSWNHYGVILSGSQLMLFKDDDWFDSKIADLKDPSKSTTLSTLKPDVLLMTSESVALYDNSYTKYKYVFRLTCPKGNQYLFQAENEDEMNDWITKINYAATFKTVGLKMRHTRSSSLNRIKSLSVSNVNIISNVSNGTKVHKEKKNTCPQPYFNYQQNRNDGGNINDVHRRSEVLKLKIAELDGKIATLKSQLDADIRFRNNLTIMIPYKATTKDKMIQVATDLGKRLRQTFLELSRLSCYHEIMEKDLYSTIIGDNCYWQKRKSMHRNHKHLSHFFTTKKNNHLNSKYNTSDGYKSDGEVSIKDRPATFAIFSSSEF
ncbi:hypothetical protein RhiirA4_476721 [Rhizophagus irregularis]|uniref:Syt1p n=1 Tax=Rhizophagus irregularis TaxID=588596 RepID=A0A2I1G560_9GLOM|nr:hypothetical protein RhiirA4_441519 [Rhizophagus irregularis]PKY56431.1 hypothetical protein RhiirA4_476721 [Rhizophagus irregularis]